MSNIKPTQRIYDIVTQRIYDIVKDIREEKYGLPSIQRSFVWKEDRISKLMDSLMSDYPIGSFLIWKPQQNLGMRIRRFIRDYHTDDTRPISEEQSIQSLPYLVLDGQQRLQSLYLGFFGSYDGERLYFKVDSDPSEERDHLRYEFQFLTPEEASSDLHWMKPVDIVDMGIPKISSIVDSKFSADDDMTKERIKENLGKFIQVFNMEERLPLQDVKEDLPYNDVLEVFVRVNSGGMVLTKSDLVFSTLVLSTPDMEKTFIELVDELNGGGEFEFDTDFIIKTSFVVFDKGAKYDVDKLRDEEYINKLREGIDRLRASLLSTMEFLKTDAKILSKRFLKSDLALIPIIDFVHRQPHQQVPEGQAWKLLQYLYMSFLLRFYSHGADGKLDVIHGYITKYENPSIFPRRRIAKYMADRTGKEYYFAEPMLSDLDLVLNMIQGGVCEIPSRRAWSLERDHIFPRSMLAALGISDELSNGVGNLRLINKTRNVLKSDKLPEGNAEFFGSNDHETAKQFRQTREDLTEANFKGFAESREELILTKVKEFLHFESELEATEK